MVNGKWINLKSFNNLCFHLDEWCKVQSGTSLSSHRRGFILDWCASTPTLLTYIPLLRHLWKKVKIVLTPLTLGTIIRISHDGIQLKVCNIWPRIPSSFVVLSDILDMEFDRIDFTFTLSLFNIEMHVLYLMITHILLLRHNSHTSFFIFDALIMFNIKHRIHLDLLSMMLTYICSLSSHDAKTILPYEM